jgi:hypothetical protein
MELVFAHSANNQPMGPQIILAHRANFIWLSQDSQLEKIEVGVRVDRSASACRGGTQWSGTRQSTRGVGS